MFVDLDWPLNASSLLSASAELLVQLKMNVHFRIRFVFGRKLNFIFVGIFVYSRKWKMLFRWPLVYITKSGIPSRTTCKKMRNWTRYWRRTVGLTWSWDAKSWSWTLGLVLVLKKVLITSVHSPHYSDQIWHDNMLGRVFPGGKWMNCHFWQWCNQDFFPRPRPRP